MVARDPAVADLLRRTRRNERYLPGVDLPSVLELTDDLAVAAWAELGRIEGMGGFQPRYFLMLLATQFLILTMFDDDDLVFAALSEKS